MLPKEVYDSDPRFQAYEYKNFRTNLNSLKKVVEENIDQIEFNNQSVLEQLQNFPRPPWNKHGNVFWHTHPAKALLQLDVAAGKADNVKPSELKKSRPEYEAFENEQFCKAVHAEKSKQKGETFWVAKRNKKGMKKHIKQREEQLAFS